VLTFQTRKRNEVHGLSFAPDGVTLAVTAGAGVTEFWSAPTGQLVTTYPRSGGYHRPPAWGGDGGRFAFVRHFTDALRGFDPYSGREATVAFGLGPITRPLVHPSGLGVIGVREPDKALTAIGWDGGPATVRWVRSAEATSRNPLAFSADGGAVLVSQRIGRWYAPLELQLIDWDTGEVRAGTTFPSRYEVRAVASPAGGLVAVKPEFGPHVYLLHPTTLNRKPTVLKSDTGRHFTDMAFHPSGRFLAATANDATVTLFDTDTWTPAHRYSWHIGRLRCVAFSPDGTLAAAGGDTGTVAVWDVDV
jgi:WD40 repeat protein